MYETLLISPTVNPEPAIIPQRAADPSARARAFLDEHRLPTPCLVIDLVEVEAAYRELREVLAQAAPYYAVKACPEPAVIALLAELGAHFDVASRGELDLCLGLGISASRISFGNTIKRETDIAYAHARGVRMFAFDSEQELRKLAAAAPGATVVCRVLGDGEGAQWPLSRKFGCEPTMAVELLSMARACGLRGGGVSFHVGSQQVQPGSWRPAIAQAADVFAAVAESGARLELLNIGGGFPARYCDPVLPMSAYGEAIAAAIAEAFGSLAPQVICEPGRSLVGDAGVLRSEVLLVSRKSARDEHRWVYLDAGRFGGLAETEGEAIRYRIACSRGGGPEGPVILAGPTCDSVDVMYEKHRYELPLQLAPGDTIDFLAAGAYTTSYASVGFNGFPPPATYCI